MPLHPAFCVGPENKSLITFVIKNPETDFRVEPEGQKRIIASQWLLPLLQS